MEDRADIPRRQRGSLALSRPDWRGMMGDWNRIGVIGAEHIRCPDSYSWAQHVEGARCFVDDPAARRARLE